MPPLSQIPEVSKAITLRNEERFEEALETLAALKKKHPTSADIEYQIGWTYDASERCRLAIPHYKRALDLGLQEDRDGCFVALGSSLRAVGEYQQSKELIIKGIEEFPENRALRVFLALTLYNLGEYKNSVSALIKELTETTQDREIASYKHAFLGYAEDLDARW